MIKTHNHVEEEKIIKEVQANMGKLEVNVKELWSSSNGNSMGVLDILIPTLLPIIEGIEEDINISIDAICMRSYDKVHVIKETVPNHKSG